MIFDSTEVQQAVDTLALSGAYITDVELSTRNTLYSKSKDHFYLLAKKSAVTGYLG